MHKIDSPGAAAAMPAFAAIGATVGWFTKGDTGSGVQATVFDEDWMNMVQAELLAILVAAAIAPAKGTNNQVLAGINSLIATAIAALNLHSASTHPATDFDAAGAAATAQATAETYAAGVATTAQNNAETFATAADATVLAAAETYATAVRTNVGTQWSLTLPGGGLILKFGTVSDTVDTHGTIAFTNRFPNFCLVPMAGNLSTSTADAQKSTSAAPVGSGTDPTQLGWWCANASGAIPPGNFWWLALGW